VNETISVTLTLTPAKRNGLEPENEDFLKVKGISFYFTSIAGMKGRMLARGGCSRNLAMFDMFALHQLGHEVLIV